MVRLEFISTEPLVALLTPEGSFADGKLGERLLQIGTEALDHTPLLMVCLSEVEHFDSDTMGTLSDLLTQAAVINGSLVIICPTTQVNSLICMTGASDALRMFGSKQTGLQALMAYATEPVF